MLNDLGDEGSQKDDKNDSQAMSGQPVSRAVPSQVGK
jgi:hypothetical protein